MKSRFAVPLVIVGASLALAACGSSSGTTTVTETGSPAEPSAESPATQNQIEKAERETEEAELEAALAKKRAAQQAARTKKAAAKRAAANAEAAQKAEAEEESTPEVPEVIGMRLPEAESTLRAAGFATQAENTDTTFGIVIKSHYTVCTESEPHGNVVTVLAQKYGC